MKLLAGMLLLTSLISGLLFSGPASALDPRRTIAQYKHTRWTAEDGAPQDIRALAQTKNGYLWIGSSDGLYRFDGLTFEHIPLQGTKDLRAGVSEIFVARDDSIWVGYSDGGLSLYRNGVHRAARMPDDKSFVVDIVETTDKAVWILLGRLDLPLLRYQGGKWQQVGVDWGLPRSFLGDVKAARDGSLWVSATGSAWVLRRNAKRFEKLEENPEGTTALSLDRAGRVWLTDARATKAIHGPGTAPAGFAYPTPGSARKNHTIFDRDGNLWGVSAREGIYRVRSPSGTGERSSARAAEKVERYRAKDGLTSDLASELFEDREGNIWIGTSTGLDRLREATIVKEPALTNLPTFGDVLLGASDGSVYVGEADAVYRIRPGRDPEAIVRGGPDAQAICEGPDGSVYVVLKGSSVRRELVRPAKLVQIRGESVKELARPPQMIGLTYGCAVDANNDLWLAGGSSGMFRLKGNSWQNLMVPEEGRPRPTRMTTDAARSLLVHYFPAGFARLDPTSGRVAILRDREDHVRTLVIHPFTDGVLLGGQNGLMRRLRGGQVATLSPEAHPWVQNVGGIVQSADGDTWLISAAGIVRVKTGELARAFAGKKVALRPKIWSLDDGLPGPVNRDARGDAVLGGDGRLWFSTLAGTVWLHPGELTQNKVPPPVVVGALSANGTRYPNPHGVRLPKGTTTVQISFAALSLSIPQRNQVRYRLEGVDSGWVNPGQRRQAFYTNLGAGDYVFRVIAANNDGVWNREGATVKFSIAPTFLQSTWFLILCIVALCGLLWAAYHFRVRQVTRRLHAASEVRIAERERIARELHDTLLQGFQGLVLRFQAVADRIPAEQPIRPLIEEALERADAALVEGRNRVRDLRGAGAGADLAQRLRDVAAGLSAIEAPAFSLVVNGTPRLLRPVAGDELARIGEEAIRNAFGHANASNVVADLTYRSAEFSLRIRDDGSGLPEDISATGERKGHFGLVGMRERAERVGGALTITSRAGAGTEILLRVPSKLAYPPERSWWRSLWARATARAGTGRANA